MKPFVLLLLVLSLWACCTAPPRAEFEIAFGEPPAVDSARWHATLRVLERRIEEIAVGGFDLTPVGDGKYTLRILTPFTDREVEYVLSTPGRLEFWETGSWSSDLAGMLPWSRKLWEEEQTASNRDAKVLASHLLSRNFDSEPCAMGRISSEAYPVVARVLDSLQESGMIAGNIRFGRQIRKDGFGEDVYTVYLLKCDPARNGPFADNSSIEELTFAAPSKKNLFLEVIVRFNEAGAERLHEVTARNIGKQIAISFDGEVLMAPVIREPIDGGKASVSQGTESVWEGEFFLNCMPAIVGSGTLEIPVHCRRR